MVNPSADNLTIFQTGGELCRERFKLQLPAAGIINEPSFWKIACHKK
jgi:hypothetical protein